jgi:hypothetical protein
MQEDVAGRKEVQEEGAGRRVRKKGQEEGSGNSSTDSVRK